MGRLGRSPGHAATVERLGHPALVVTSTGGPPAGHFEDLTDDTWRAGIDSTLLNVVRMSRLVLPAMRAAEQLTSILEGALRFSIGPEGTEALIVRAGEVLVIPSGILHQAEALEDTLDVDVFCPPRQDWLDGTDDYFHRK
jgi:NAD(P)-dependent dehydrogenase (short-subunit alcohol dehydrogenase family)